MKMWGVAKADTSLLCDDDNDLKIAAVVNSVFLPTISAVRRLRPQQETNLHCIVSILIDMLSTCLCCSRDLSFRSDVLIIRYSSLCEHGIAVPEHGSMQIDPDENNVAQQ